MMRWFGEPWGSSTLGVIPQVDVPLGAVCVWCEELIDEHDSGIVYANGPVAHRDCFLRQVIGGVNHIRGCCTCHGGTEPPDPPEMTRREAAEAAVAAFYRLHGA
jgi:hypothetical protein